MRSPRCLRDTGENNGHKDGGTGKLLLGSTDALKTENDKFRSAITNLQQSQGDSLSALRTWRAYGWRQAQDLTVTGCPRGPNSQPGSVSPQSQGPEGRGGAET